MVFLYHDVFRLRLVNILKFSTLKFSLTLHLILSLFVQKRNEEREREGRRKRTRSILRFFSDQTSPNTLFPRNVPSLHSVSFVLTFYASFFILSFSSLFLSFFLSRSLSLFDRKVREQYWLLSKNLSFSVPSFRTRRRRRRTLLPKLFFSLESVLSIESK